MVSANLILAQIFSNVIKHGKELKTKEQNHIIPLILEFKSTPTYEQLKSIKTRYGTSLAKYGEYLLDPEGARFTSTIFNSIVGKTIDASKPTSGENGDK